MKKTYMTPLLEVVKIETQGMLALSGGLDTTDTTITNPSDFGAREFFDDDESFFDESGGDYDNF
jgi:hypothetical protein